MAYILIDLQVSPYHTPDQIRAEIQRVKALGDSPEVDDAIHQLEQWLKSSENAKPA